MNPFVNSLLSLLFLVAGGAAAAVMIELKGRPMDRPAAGRLILAHRLLGYLFAAVFLFMLAVMVQKAGSLQEEMNAKTIIHIAFAIFTVPLLALKILIARRYKVFTRYLFLLGAGIFSVSVVFVILTAGYYYLHRSDIRYTAISAADEDILDNETGRHFLFERCGKCHTFERVFRSFKTKKGWSDTVNRMARIDAPNIRPFEVKQIIFFLVNQQKERKNNQAGKVSEKIGKTILERKCTLCHDLERVVQASKTENQWAATIDRMISNMGDEEFISAGNKKILAKYLSKED